MPSQTFEMPTSSVEAPCLQYTENSFHDGERTFSAPCRLTPFFNPVKGEARPIYHATSETEYMDCIRKIPYACEELTGPCKFYLDVDAYLAPEDFYPSQDGSYIEKRERSVLNIAKDAIMAIPILKGERYVGLSRKPRKVLKNGTLSIKVSWRFVFPTVIMKTNKEIGIYLTSIGVVHDKPFDLGVYNAGRIMSAPLCAKPRMGKDIDECPILNPLLLWSGTLECRLITCVDPSLKIVDIQKWLPKTPKVPVTNKDKNKEKSHPAQEERDIRSSIQKLLQCIAADCCYSDWFSILCVIKDIIEDEDAAYDLAREWSSSAPTKFDCAEFQKTWASIKRRGAFTIGTLKMRAKQDNYGLYIEYFPRAHASGAYVISENLLKKLKGCGKNTSAHAILSDVAHEVIGNGYAFVGKNAWYAFVHGKWESDMDAVTLRTEIKGKVARAVFDAHMAERKLTYGDMTAEKRKQHNDIADGLYAQYVAYQNSKSLDYIVKEMREYYLDTKFESKLDSARGLIAFTDGVVEWDTKKYRPARPDDYIQKTTGYSFSEMMDSPTELVNEISGIIQATFADKPKDVHDYFLFQFANMMDGHNKRESFDIWVGDKGSNGKTTFLLLAKYALGEYFATMSGDGLGKNVELSPQIIKLKGVRMAAISEPNMAAGLSESLIKTLSGNDDVTVRTLYKEPIVFQSCASIALICNEIPKLHNVDNGVKRRLKVLSFDMQFMAKPSATNPKQAQADTSLKERLERNWKAYGMAFMKLIYEFRISKQYDVMLESAYVPECCRVATNDYFRGADPYEVMLEGFDVTGMENDRVSASDLYKAYLDVGGRATQQAFGRAFLKAFPDGNVKKIRANGMLYSGIKCIDN